MFINAFTHTHFHRFHVNILKLKAKYLLIQPPHLKCFLEMDISKNHSRGGDKAHSSSSERIVIVIVINLVCSSKCSLKCYHQNHVNVTLKSPQGPCHSASGTLSSGFLQDSDTVYLS